MALSAGSRSYAQWRKRRLVNLEALCRITRHFHNAHDENYVPVTIVGGGPTGLFLSHLLSNFRIRHVLLERTALEDMFLHPQAHFLNTRTMELLRVHTPRVYERVVESMPDPSHFGQFSFGYNMCDVPLARVHHPVANPIQWGKDMNGRLLDSGLWNSEEGDEDELHRQLSPCSVGHLAQHRFAKILFEEANTAAELSGAGSSLVFGSSVVAVDQKRSCDELEIETDDGKSWRTSVCVGADGAHSTVRSLVFGSDVAPSSSHVLQHLVNVHVQLNPDQDRMMQPNCMLYSIMNEHLVAMVVSHGHGEYIIQIPFFPPHQEMTYDYESGRLQVLLESIFGVPDILVKSVRPWAMTSWVAPRYVVDRAVLVGDAAHVFPPAGGFGMNTGIQDVHNLGWKLFGMLLSPNGRAPATPQSNWWLTSYEDERRSVAESNAALSERNFQRLLKVFSESFITLDTNNPTVLQTGLRSTAPFIPLEYQRDVFRTLLRTALMPLQFLKDSTSAMYITVKENLRRVLSEGHGLPLLFPPFELAFSYAEKNQKRPASDTIHDQPLVCVGKRIPHVPLLHDYDGVRRDLSTIDLPTALLRGCFRPCWIVVRIFPSKVNSDELEEGRQRWEQKTGFGVHIVSISLRPLEGIPALTRQNHWHMYTKNKESADLLQSSKTLLIRPDGHVFAYVSDADGDELLDRVFAQVGRDVTDVT